MVGVTLEEIVEVLKELDRVNMEIALKENDVTYETVDHVLELKDLRDALRVRMDHLVSISDGHLDGVMH